MKEVMNASGRMINPYALKPEDFDPRIMAQTLSRICRLGTNVRFLFCCSTLLSYGISF